MPPDFAPNRTINAAGCIVLPGLVDAHTHLDKAFTLPRMREVKPGLLGAIEAMMVDRQSWTEADIHARASRALQWACDAGTVHLRTHCDWWEPDAQPLAWNVLRALAHDWADRITLERVSLIPLHLYTDHSAAMQLAATVAAALTVFTGQALPQAVRHDLGKAAGTAMSASMLVSDPIRPASAAAAGAVCAKAEEINTGRTPLVVIGAKGLRREAPGPAGGEPAIVCGGLPARAARAGGRRAGGAL